MQLPLTFGGSVVPVSPLFFWTSAPALSLQNFSVQLLTSSHTLALILQRFKPETRLEKTPSRPRNKLKQGSREAGNLLHSLSPLPVADSSQKGAAWGRPQVAAVANVAAQGKMRIVTVSRLFYFFLSSPLLLQTPLIYPTSIWHPSTCLLLKFSYKCATSPSTSSFILEGCYPPDCFLHIPPRSSSLTTICMVEFSNPFQHPCFLLPRSVNSTLGHSSQVVCSYLTSLCSWL